MSFISICLSAVGLSVCLSLALGLTYPKPETRNIRAKSPNHKPLRFHGIFTSKTQLLSFDGFLQGFCEFQGLGVWTKFQCRATFLPTPKRRKHPKQAVSAVLSTKRGPRIYASSRERDPKAEDYPRDPEAQCRKIPSRCDPHQDLKDYDPSRFI